MSLTNPYNRTKQVGVDADLQLINSAKRAKVVASAEPTAKAVVTDVSKEPLPSSVIEPTEEPTPTNMIDVATKPIVTPVKEKKKEEYFDLFDTDDDEDLRLAVSIANEEEDDEEEDQKLPSSVPIAKRKNPPTSIKKKDGDAISRNHEVKIALNFKPSNWTVKGYSFREPNFKSDTIEKWIRESTMWSDNSCKVIVSRNTYQIENDSTIESDGVGVELDGVIDNVVTSQLNPITNKLFGAALKQLCIGRLDHCANISTYDNNGNLVVANRALSFLFTLVPMVDNNASKQNRYGLSPEDPRYWVNHIIHRQRGSEKVHILECAMKIFSCFIPENEKADHYNFIDDNTNIGPFVGSHGFMMFVAYGKYAYVVAGLMSLPIVRAAFNHNWYPVLCIKDCIHQTDRSFGINGSKISTCDMTTKSFVCLVGFHRQRSKNNERDFDAISVLNCGAAITTKQQPFIRLNM